MEKRLILRGAFVGGLAGLLAFAFARIFAEPQIQKAIDYERGRAAAQALLDKAAGLPVDPAEADVFSRTIQADVGLGVGLIMFGIAMGLLFGVVYAVCLGRVGRVRPRSLSLLVAGAGFLGLYLIPFLKYPANPPSIGHSDTIKQRSGLYLVMVLTSVVVLIAAVWMGQQLKARFGNWTATLLTAACAIVVIGVVMLLLPRVGHLSANDAFGKFDTETPQPLKDAHGNIVFPGFPADVLFNFRLYSVGAQLLMWSAIGLAFAPLADRLLRPLTADREQQPVRA